MSKIGLKNIALNLGLNRPASPHLNGKVERSQKTDKSEFYATIDLADDRLDLLLAEWQHYYNWDRPQSSLNEKTPMDVYYELMHKTPFQDEASKLYCPKKRANAIS